MTSPDPLRDRVTILTVVCTGLVDRIAARAVRRGR